MRILHIAYSDKGGGAAIAAYRHHEAMRIKGIDSRMLVINKKSDDISISSISNKIIQFGNRIINGLLNRLLEFFATWSLNITGYDLSRHTEVKNADIIILHWVNNNTISIKSIAKILKSGKPVYWFMHDMWPITGGCHHAFDCNKFENHCFKCEMFHNRQGSRINKDLSYWQFEEKLKYLKPYENLKFIVPSKWLCQKVKSSYLFSNHEIKICRNILNLEIFTPQPVQESRDQLGLPKDKRIILFGADNITSPYKGWKYLKDALNENYNNTVCAIYGDCDPNSLDGIKMDVYRLGKIDNVNTLIKLYSACDLFVSPSLADNYPNVLIEAMACGLPCVGFKTGGITEIIIDGYNGKLVNEYSSTALYSAIKSLLEDNNLNAMKGNAIKSVQCNSYNHIIEVY